MEERWPQEASGSENRCGDDSERDVTGEELQRQVPKPSRHVPRWFRSDEPVSEKREVVEGALEAVGTLGPIGAVVAIPAAVIAWMRRRRH